jgi:hypothetical protein
MPENQASTNQPPPRAVTDHGAHTAQGGLAGGADLAPRLAP